MMLEVIGYKLVEISTGNVLQSWGGVSGQTPGMPTVLVLPGDTQVHCPSLETDYLGYRLVKWAAEAPQSEAEAPEDKLARFLADNPDVLTLVEGVA